MMEKKRSTVAVVFGGRSGEHTISCATAAGVLEALHQTGYEVRAIGITREGTWRRVSSDPDRWRLNTDVPPQVDDNSGPVVELTMRGDNAFTDIDVVFPLLHGPYGEDGTIQGLFETLGVRYVGSGVLASAAGMDKHFMKLVLADAGIPSAPYVHTTLGRFEADPESVISASEELGEVLFVKPCRAGSSLGITRVDDLTHLPEAVKAAAAHDPKVLIEAAVAGRELECAVLADLAGGTPNTTWPGEIAVDGADFYDYETKYFNTEAARLMWPAELPEVDAQRLRRLAAQTFAAFDCEGLARVDFFYTARGEIMVNEINTMPGFTPFSMYPSLWEKSGVSYPDLLTHLIELALNRPLGLRA